MAGEYIEDFRAKLQAKIDRHTKEAARLTRWRDLLDADGFDWDAVTEAQAWAIWSIECAESKVL